MTTETRAPLFPIGDLISPPPPIREDEGGTLRVGNTRVRLDTVIEAYKGGCEPVEIQVRYPTLALTDVYAVVTYYLWNPERVEAYLAERRAVAEEIRRKVEARFPPDGVLARLEARRTEHP